MLLQYRQGKKKAISRNKYTHLRKIVALYKALSRNWMPRNPADVYQSPDIFDGERDKIRVIYLILKKKTDINLLL